MGEPDIQSFRDLDAWKVAMDLTVLAYTVAKGLPDDERYELSAQLRRASVSVPSNIAEGQSCGLNGRYIHHLRIALGSVDELSTQIELALRLGLVQTADAAAVAKQLTRTRQLLFGLLRSRRRRRLLKTATCLALLLCWFGVLWLAGLD